MYREPYIRYPAPYSNPLEKSLQLIKEAVQGERNDELFYDYLISVAPTANEKEIISSIRDDERKHNKMFRKIYKDLTGMDVPAIENELFEKPKSYLAGIEKALFGELAAVEKYRDIRAGLPNRYYRDMVFEILTDELKHANKYNYMLSKNQAAMNKSDMFSRYSNIKETTRYTAEEAMEIAKKLGIDFTKEKFNLEQFMMGLDTELEHGKKYFPTDVTEDDPIITAKIALAHLREFPDYYTRLAKLEADAKSYWDVMNKKNYTPDQWVMYITPLVNRALAEYKTGINIQHLFEEFILSGVLVGLGKTPLEAIEQVEEWEKTGESELLKKSKMKK